MKYTIRNNYGEECITENFQTVKKIVNIENIIFEKGRICIEFSDGYILEIE